MKRILLGAVCLSATISLLPFVGGSGPALAGQSYADAPVANKFASNVTLPRPVATTRTHFQPKSIPTNLRVNKSPVPTVDSEHLAQKPIPVPVPASVPAAEPASQSSSSRSPRAQSGSRSNPAPGSSTSQQSSTSSAPQTAASCPSAVGGSSGSAPSGSSASGIAGTTSADVASFAAAYNQIRVANCLSPVPMGNIRYDSCMEARLYWMAEDPSTNPGNTWGHTGVRSIAPDANGVYYSDAVPARGCDGNLAGGSGNTGATVAQKWWDSLSHRASLYRPSYTGSTSSVCIYFAMTHGGLPSESVSFARAAARWGSC